jgi:predicted nucleic acid-binding Zn ribbon protein
LNRSGSKNEKERPNAPASALKDLLGDLLGDLGVESKIAECQAQLVWEEAVGPALARYARPLRVHRGKLEVAVPSAVWRSQLSFMQREIVTRINELVGSQVVKELKLINKQDVNKRPNIHQGEGR